MRHQTHEVEGIRLPPKARRAPDQPPAGWYWRGCPDPTGWVPGRASVPAGTGAVPSLTATTPPGLPSPPPGVQPGPAAPPQGQAAGEPGSRSTRCGTLPTAERSRRQARCSRPDSAAGTVFPLCPGGSLDAGPGDNSAGIIERKCEQRLPADPIEGIPQRDPLGKVGVDSFVVGAGQRELHVR